MKGSQIRLDRLPDVLPANRAVVVGGLKRPLAGLADAQVPAGQDHDTFLLILADDTEFVLALTLHLLEEQVLHILARVPFFPRLPPLTPLQEIVVIAALETRTDGFLSVRVVHGAHET